MCHDRRKQELMNRVAKRFTKLGVQANITFLHCKDIDAVQRFNKQELGLKKQGISAHIEGEIGCTWEEDLTL